MSDKAPRLRAYRNLPGVMTACSWDAGWRSILLRAFREPASTEEFTTLPTDDHLIVLVTGGACAIEAYSRGVWNGAQYRAGSIGMTAAHDAAKLRWRGDTESTTLQLHVPSATIERVFDELKDGARVELSNRLLCVDPLIEQVMLSLKAAMADGAPELYAETAAEFLAAHLVLRHGGFELPSVNAMADDRLRRVDAFMRENLSASVSLEALASHARLSRFHLLRLFKHAYGETPLKRLTRLRMDNAQRLLTTTRMSITEIAAECGYQNPAHFAAVFRRHVGVSPRAYRQQ